MPKENDSKPNLTAGSTSANGSLNPELVAVIAAAVAATLDQPHRIINIQPLNTPAQWVNPWTMVGRTQLFGSHRVR